MTRLFLICLALLAIAAPAAAQAPSAVTATVARQGDRWTVEYDFGRRVPAWAFVRSALSRERRTPWRTEQWEVLTPGVSLQRRGHYDVLVSRYGDMPRRVRIAMRPAAVDLEADYDPALVFSDGAVALFTNQFDVFALSAPDEAESLPQDLNGVPIDGTPSRVTYADRDGPVMVRGQRIRRPVLADADTYVLFGRSEVIETDAFTAVIDPGLADWIGDELSAFIPQVMDAYGASLGRLEGDKPMLMISWSGPTPGLRSMGGSVLPGLIVMTFEGQVLTLPDAEVATAARWFIAHEAAHFWMGQKVRYEYARDAWITEGGADIMAIRMLQQLDSGYDGRGAVQGLVDECIGLTAGGKAINTAAERGEHRAYYACGAVFWMVAERSLRHANRTDVFDVIRPLLEDNAVDGVLTAQEWRDHLTYVSDDPSLAEDIRRMTDEGVADPAAAIAGLFERVGVRHERTTDGGVRLL